MPSIISRWLVKSSVQQWRSEYKIKSPFPIHTTDWVVQSAGSEEYDIECRPCCLTGWRGEAVLATLHVWWFILIFLLSGPAPAPASTMAGHDGTYGGRHSHTVWLSDCLTLCDTVWLSDWPEWQSDQGVTDNCLPVQSRGRALLAVSAMLSVSCSEAPGCHIVDLRQWQTLRDTSHSDSDRHFVTFLTQTVTVTPCHFTHRHWETLRGTSNSDTDRHFVTPHTTSQTLTDTDRHHLTELSSLLPGHPGSVRLTRSDELDKLLDSPLSCTEGQWLPLLTTENIIISQPAVLPVMNIICQLLQWLSANVATFQILLIVRTGQRRPAMTIVGHNYSYVFNFEQVSSNISRGSL